MEQEPIAQGPTAQAPDGQPQPPDDQGDTLKHPSSTVADGKQPRRRWLIWRRGRPIARLTHRATLLLVFASLLALTLVGAVSAYAQYSQARDDAADGMRHLKHMQALLASQTQHPGASEAATLSAMQRDLTVAERDFALARGAMGRNVFAVANGVPAAHGPLSAAAALVAAADEACLAGLDLLRDAGSFLPLLHANLAANAPTTTPSGATAETIATPALTTVMLQRLTMEYEDAVRHLTQAVAYARGADLSALPANLITPQQRSQLHTLLAAWPTYAPQLATIDAWLRVAPNLLGLNGPTRLLVELMDRGETRATGGYIGDYGVLTIEQGKLAPFALNDVFTLDTPYVRKLQARRPPAVYAWWPFPAFGLRDSNLSPDFPTSAQLSIRQLAIEGGPDAQGVVALTAPVIARALAVLGPVQVPEYNEVVTAQNLEALVRHYTENAAARASDAHERFTLLLGHAFMSKLHGLSASQFVSLVQAMLTSLRAKEIQVYLSDPAAQSLLVAQGLDGALAHGPGDALTVVDDNLSGNKSNLFTTITSTDAVTLDTQGTATHHVTMTYQFDSSLNPQMRTYLYGRHIYRAYLRIYTPPDARLATFDGFNRRFQQINTSDEPNRQMWGGYLYVHDGVPYDLHFVWSVPHVAVQDATGQWRYQLTIQHQAGSNQQFNITVTGPAAPAPLLTFTGALDHDRTFSIDTLAARSSP